MGRILSGLKRELTFDLQTTEDAAHQLAYFDGLGALEVLLGLEDAIEAVTPGDIQRVASRYLQPHQRTIGWSLPGKTPTVVFSADRPQQFGVPRDGPGKAFTARASVPAITRLSGGLPIIWQQVATSPTVHAQVLLPGEAWEGPDLLSTGFPEPGFSSLANQFLSSELNQGLDLLARQLQQLQRSEKPESESIQDPGARLEALLSSHVGGTRAADNPEAAPLAIVVSGDLDPEALFAGLERRFGSLVPGSSTGYEAEEAPDKQVFSWMAHPVAQAQLGYGVRAPALSTLDSAPWQALLYILSHGYEGRLGKEAISRRGLIYYIDSAYHSDAERGWISLAIGVDPLKLKVMDSLLQEQLQGLLINPPSEEEVREARQHFLGRYLTANQSNLERSTFLARQYIQHGRLLSDDEITRGIESITREQVLAIIPRFVNGTTVVVDYQEAPPANN